MKSIYSLVLLAVLVLGIGYVALSMLEPVSICESTGDQYVSFTTLPDGADVYMSGQYLGATNFIECYVAAGVYDITITKSGYQTIILEDFTVAENSGNAWADALVEL